MCQNEESDSSDDDVCEKLQGISTNIQQRSQVVQDIRRQQAENSTDLAALKSEVAVMAQQLQILTDLLAAQLQIR
jgi:hypothetical protein